nr:SSP14 [Albugo laibachii Nc14]|eukprot:CCA17477.1 SSP14 [Albugo laibachii Nc14]
MRVDNVSVYQLAAFVLLFVLLSSWLISNISSIQFIFSRFLSRKQSTVLLLGPANAGKTALLHLLRNGMDVDTVTSMKENDYRFTLHSSLTTKNDTNKLHIIDFPGHERLRNRVFELTPITSKIVFLMDASDRSSWRTAAEYLHDLFSNPKLNDLAPPMLIACNKMDQIASRSSKSIQETLEHELTQLKTTRASMETHDQSDFDQETVNVPVGREGSAFTFETDSPCECLFTDCSVKNREIEGIVDFVFTK